MGLLDFIFRQAPGAIAGIKRGKRVGREEEQQRQDIQRQRMFQDQDRARRDAMDAANTQRLLEEYQMRQADAQLIREERAARVAQLKAQAEGTGYYERPTPQAPRDPVADHRANLETDRAMGAGSFRPRVGTGGGTAAPKPGKILPASAAIGLSGTENVLNAAREAQKAMQDANAKGMNVTGPITGRLTAITEGLGMAKPEAISVRGKLANVTSEIMKQRSGGAITPQEFVRLEPFLASKNDTETNAAQKLTDLITYLESNRETSLQTFEDTGYDVAKIRGRADASPSPTGSGSLADQWEALVKGGMSPAEATAKLNRRKP